MSEKAMKAALRKEFKAKIAAIPKIVKESHSKIVAQMFLDLPKVKKSERFSVYLSRDDEVDTTLIIRTLLQQGKQIFVPYYKGEGMKMVPLYSWQDYERMPETSWNIKQPEDGDRRPDALDLGGLDVIACPGLGFSENFFRLGRGKGYYDKYIHRCNLMQCEPFLVGLAFNEQMTSTDLALGERDKQLSLILYPDFHRVRRRNNDETTRQFKPIFKSFKYTFPEY